MSQQDKLVRDFPGNPGSVYDITHWNNDLAAAGWANRIVAARAQLMDPRQAQYFNAWARVHPTVDPRTWAPLAKQMIDPYSDVAMGVADADIKANVANGTYGMYPGTKQQKDPPAPPDPQTSATEGDGGFWGSLLHAAGNVTHAAGNALNFSADLVSKGPLTAVRAGEAIFSTAYQYEIADARTSLGASKHRDHALAVVGKQQGLSPEQVSSAQSFLNAEGSARMTPQQTIDFAKSHSLMPEGFTPEQWDSYLNAYGTLAANPAVAQRLAGGQDASKVFDQTDLGIVVRSFTDGTKGNYLLNRPEDGAQYDPKTGKWYVANPDGTFRDAQWVDHGGVFTPSEAKVEAESNAIRAYDIRTVEEKKNNISPVAWTLGRGIAQKYYSPDQTAFGVLSGVIDFNSSLFLDPVNLIPVGFAADGAKSFRAALADVPGAGTLLRGKEARAFLGWGDEQVIATRSAQMAGSKILKSPVEGMKEAGSGGAHLAVPEAVQRGKDIILDPVLSQRGYVLDGSRVAKDMGEGGLVTVPHAKFVSRQHAWDWLTNGTGSRAVDAIAAETSPMRIHLGSNRKIGGDLANQLANASTPEEVRAILAPQIGITIEDARAFRGFAGQAPVVSKVPGLSPTFLKGLTVRGAELEGSGLFTSAGRSVLARMYSQHGALGAGRSLYRSPFRLAPSSGVGFDAEDVDSVLSEMERFFRGVRLPDDTWIPKADEMIRAKNGVQRYNAIYDQNNGILKWVNSTLTDEFGINDKYANDLTRAFDSGLDQAKRIWVNKDLEAASYGSQADGRIGRALLLQEMLSSRIYLPDYRSLRRATGMIANIDKLPMGDLEKAAMVSNAMTSVTSVWRDLVLMRPAYIFRELGELAFSASLAGGKGAFTHPYGFIATSMQSALAAEMSHLVSKIVTRPGTTIYKGLQTGADSAARFLVSNGDERKAWEAAASLPDFKRPEVLRGKTPEEAGALYDTLPPSQRSEVFWDQVDKKALQDYLLLHEGVQWFFPGLRSEWARVNGKKFNEEWKLFNEGQQVHLPAFMHENNFSAGNMLIDEPAARGATRGVRTLARDTPTDRPAYINALIDSKLGAMAQDSLMKQLAAPDADTTQILADWRGTYDWAMRREMQPNLWGKDQFPDKGLGDINIGEDEQYLTGYANMLNMVTGSDRRLLDAVHTGKFEDLPLDSSNVALTKYLEEKLNDKQWAGQLPQVLSDIPKGMGLKGRYSGAVNSFFHTTGELSDIFARSPLLRHFYADYVVTHAKFMSTAARETAVRNLREAGDIKLAKKVLLAKRDPNVVGTLGTEEMEMAASGYARKQVARSYYNAHRRQNYAVALRIISPFIQATFNTFKRWAVMSLQNPQMMYRTLKPIEALTEPGSAVIYDVLGKITGDDAMQGLYTPGHPEASVDGFFFHNAYGERVFAFPMVRQVYNIMAGKYNPVMRQDIPPGGLPLANAGNLNVAGVTVNPGMGPLMTLGASMLTGDRIYQDNWGGDALRAMFPYGLPDGPALHKALAAVSPTAFRKVMLTPEQQANSATKLLPTLAETGEYDLTKESEKRRMLADAVALSSSMNTFSAIFGAATPSTFSWNYALKVTGNDKDGSVRFWMMQDRLAQEWRQYTAPKSDATYQEDYDNGAIQFIKDYGIFALYATQPRTEMPGSTASVSPTADVWSFRSDHPDTYKQYAGVIGLLFPGGDPASEFSTAERNLYQWQAAEGERVYKNPSDFWDDANTAIGWILYSAQAKKVMEAVPDPNQQTPILARLADNVAEKFPGWTRTSTTPGKFTLGINALREAVNDPDIQTLPGTPYIHRYLEARDDAIAELRDLGYGGTLNADYAAVQRAKLATLATKLVQQDTSGTFVYAWTRFLGTELESSG